MSVSKCVRQYLSMNGRSINRVGVIGCSAAYVGAFLLTKMRGVDAFVMLIPAIAIYAIIFLFFVVGWLVFTMWEANSRKMSFYKYTDTEDYKNFLVSEAPKLIPKLRIW